MEYDIYHDESQEAGYWHGILLVPRATRPQLLDVLRLIRSNTRYEHQLALKRLDSTTGKIYRCVRSWLHFGIASLIQTLKGRRYPYYVGLDRPKPEFDFLVSSIGAKFVVFRVKAGHAQLVGLPDYAARIETTFRMGLKGGLQLFSKSADEIRITSLHFDGHGHHQRRLDRRRIIDRIGPMRDNIRIDPNAEIYDESGNHNAAKHQPCDDCQLLQLTDLLIGGFRTVLGTATHAHINTSQRHCGSSYNAGMKGLRVCDRADGSVASV